MVGVSVRSVRWFVLVGVAVIAIVASMLVAVARPAPAHAATVGTGGQFVTATGRILDSRNGTGGYTTPFPASTWRTVTVDGVAGIPSSGVSAVSMIVTAIAPQGTSVGQVTGRTDANASSTTVVMTYGGTGIGTTSNSSVLAVSSTGSIQLRTDTTIDLTVDVQGYYTASTSGTAPGGFVSVPGTRIVDTRSGLGAPHSTLAPGASINVQVTGAAGIPSGASGVVANVIVINESSTQGAITPFPTGSTQPQNYLAYAPGNGVATALGVQVGLSSAGQMTIANQSGTTGTIDVTLDIQGYFTATDRGGVFTPDEARLYNSQVSPNTQFASNETRAIQVSGQQSVPAMGSGVSAVAITLTAVHAANSGGGGVAWADGTTEPQTTSISFANNSIRSNTIIVPLGADGKIDLQNVSSDTTNFVIDLQGWYNALPTGPETVGLTGSRKSATNLPFPISDQTTAQVDVATGNLLVSNLGLTLPGVNSTTPVGAAYNSLGWQTGDSAVPDANRWEYSLDNAGDLSANSKGIVYTGADGSTWQFTLNADGSYTTPAGLVAQLTANGGGYQLVQLVSKTTIQFNASGQATSVADGATTPNTVIINHTGYLVSSIVSTAGATGARTVTVSYGNNALTFTQTSGSSTRSIVYTKDANGNLTSYTDAAGNTTSFAYTGTNLTQITGPTGAVTNFTYDGNHRVTQVDQLNTTTGGAGTSTTRISYASTTTTYVAGPDTSTSVAVATGAHTTYTITPASELVSTAVDAAGRQQSGTYDGNANPTSQTTGTGAAGTTAESKGTEAYGANSGQSLTSVVNPGGSTTSLQYNTPSNAYLPSQVTTDSQTSSGGQSTTYNYAGNNLTSTMQGGATASVTPNADGTTAAAYAPGNTGNPTTYTYTNHQLTGITPVTGGSLGAKALTYDAFGRLASESDGAGRTTSYTYDKDDRRLTTSFSDGTPTVTDTYDAAGRELTEASGSGTVTNTYDQLGHLLTTRNTAGGGTITYTYDKAGNNTGETKADGTITNTFDASGIPLTTTYPTSSGTSKIVYVTDSYGRRTNTYSGANASATTWASHASTVFDNASGRIIEQQAYVGSASSPTKVADTYYCYNTANPAPTPGATPNCVTSEDHQATETSKLQWTEDAMSGEVTTYSYNSQGRLTTVANSGGGSTAGAWTYTYDNRGNKLTSVFTTSSGSVTSSTSYTYNAANQITNSGFSYDGAGNVTAVPEYTFTYNGAEQMTSAVHNGSQTTTYTYAGADQKALLTENTSGSTSRSIVYGRSDANGNPTIVTYTVAGKTADLVTDPTSGCAVMLATPSGVDGLYIYDATGDPVGLAVNDPAAFGVTYDPYGVGTISYDGGGDGSGNNPYAFKGGTISQAVGLVKFGLRWYDPYTGSWMQQDTLDAPLDPHNANRYAYAADDPVNGTDPTGMAWTAGCFAELGLGIIGFVGGIAEAVAFVGITVGTDGAAAIADAAVAGETAAVIAGGVGLIGNSITRCR